MHLFHNVFLVIKDEFDPLLYAIVREGNKVHLPHTTLVAVNEHSHPWRSVAAHLGNNFDCFGNTKLRAIIIDE